MRQVGLIAFNFVREQRWPILVLMLSVVALNLVGLFQNRWTTNDEDVLFLFKQVAVYGVAFAVFFGASAIHNERKTRRILSVLSKSVGRGQYIAGLLCGIIFAVFMYCCAMAVTGTWILRPARFPVSRVWFLMTCLMMASVLAGAVAVFFSTFLNPLFATLSAIICLALPATAAFQFKSSWAVAIPVYSMLELLMRASFSEHWAPKWNLILLAAVESGLCWLAASWVFSRRDIAVAVD
jgi:ABC-type transport system involved in multi-copper enzyme maturation permease subunit